MSPATILLLTFAAPSHQWIGAPVSSPRRVVSLAPAFTELAFALGRGDRVVGVTRFDDAPPEAKALPRVGGFVDPDPEAVLARKPDVALAVPVPGARQRLEVLARLGVPVLVMPAATLDDLFGAIDALGRLLDAEAEARALATSLHDRLEAARASTRAAPPLRAVIVVGYRPLVAAGPHSFLGHLLELLHATNVVDRGPSFAHLDLEALAASKPEVVIDLTMGESAPDGLWQRLATLSGGRPPRVVRLDDSCLLRVGPRLGQALDLLGAALRPRP